jgi:stage V sporulation protein G
MKQISEVEILPIKPVGGLVAFASLVVDKSLYLGSIAVHKRLDGTGYRLTYPTKKIGSHSLNIYHPVDKELARLIEHAVVVRCHELFDESEVADENI